MKIHKCILISSMLFIVAVTESLFAHPELQPYDMEYQVAGRNVGFVLTNYGYFGSVSPTNPTMEYPIGSGNNVLHHSVLWIGGVTQSGDTLLSCGDGNVSTGYSEWHQTGADTILIVDAQSALSDKDTRCSFSDSWNIPGHQPLGVCVIQQSYLWRNAHFIIVDFTIINEGMQGTLSNLYVGLMCDFDLPGETWNPVDNLNDLVEYEVDNKLALVYNDEINPLGNSSAGVRMLSHNPVTHAVWDWEHDPVTDREKFELLSQEQLDGIPVTANDYRFLQSAGPFTLEANDTIRIAFAFLGASNRNSLQGQSIVAQNHWDNLVSDGLGKRTGNITEMSGIPKSYDLQCVFPNPFNSMTTITVGLPNSAYLDIVVYNVSGQRVATLSSGYQESGYNNFTFNANHLSSGIYFVHSFVDNKLDKVQKIVLMK